MAGITLQKSGYGVRGIINMFGLTDCTHQSARVDEGGRLSFVVADFVGSDDPDSELARMASPARILDRDCPPVLSLHGVDDVVISFEQARVLHKAIRKTRAKGQLVPMRKQGHGWGEPKAVKFSTEKVFGFLKSVTR
jgi:acetyl esterase/lipase